MKVVKTINEVREQVKEWRKNGESVALVPTMGYLHRGHASLIKKAKSENSRVVVSIFVNPIQFGENEDLDKYPRDLNHDSEVCREYGADLIFNPEPEEMYGKNFQSFVEVNQITTGLCGAKRPGHFRGVTTVVSKLFNIVKPDKAYFGEKDAQQLAVIKKMVCDLNFDIKVIGCPIIREEDGLALSSRNVYLNAEERKAALILNKALKACKASMESGIDNVEKLKNAMKTLIESEKLAKIDYIEIVDSKTLENVETVEEEVLVAIAVYIGKTRLIDNFTFFK